MHLFSLSLSPSLSLSHSLSLSLLRQGKRPTNTQRIEPNTPRHFYLDMFRPVPKTVFETSVDASWADCRAGHAPDCRTAHQFVPWCARRVLPRSVCAGASRLPCAVCWLVGQRRHLTWQLQHMSLLPPLPSPPLTGKIAQGDFRLNLSRLIVASWCLTQSEP